MKVLRLVAIISILVMFPLHSQSILGHDLSMDRELIFTTESNTTYLSVNLENVPSSVDDGSSHNISVSIQTDDVNGTLMNLLLETTGGVFENNQSTVSYQFAASNTTIFVLWTAPVLFETDVDVTITAVASLDTLEATDSASVHVNLVYFNLDVEWLVEDTYFQNETGTVGLTVVDQDTALPVDGAEVTLSLEVGKFLETGTNSIVLLTDQEGKVNADVDFSVQEFLFDENDVLLSATVSKQKYNDLLVNTTLRVIKSPPIPSVVVDFLVSQENTSFVAIFSFNATLSGRPWINATFKVTATGGSFSDGGSSAMVKTDASGFASLEWSSEGIPQTKDDVIVFFTVELLTLDYGLVFGPKQYNLTIPGIELTTSLPTTVAQSPISLFPLILAIPILWRKRK